MPSFSEYFQSFNEYQSENKLGIKTGNFRLLDNPMLCSKFLSFVAIEGRKFPDLNQWQNFLKADHRNPKKPDREDPYLYKNSEYIGRNDLEARTYRAYIFTRKTEQYRKELHEIEQKKQKQIKIKNKYSNDRAGYCLYIFDRLEPNERDFLDKYLSFEIPESKRLLHTYISGGTGSGKSEIMKTLLHHYLR